MSAGSHKAMNIAVLLGGTSAEREVSLQSGATVLTALAEAGHQVRPVDPVEADWQQQLAGVDCAFIALHGPGGEDGCIQGALDFMGVPYTGSGVLGSALAMDKQRSKQLWQGIGLPTAGFTMLSADTDWDAVIADYGKVFVKPACEGSSIGMAPADNSQQLALAYEAAKPYAGTVLAERFIRGSEYTVGILGDQALPSICMETDNEFYDYEAKYISQETRYHCPSGLDEAEEAELAKLALWAFRSLGCDGWGRVDAMRDADGTFYVLEVNTSPGMTSHSLVPMAALAVGLELPQLVQAIVELSMEARDHG
jgi:D-alanine-D-alanine ligase